MSIFAGNFNKTEKMKKRYILFVFAVLSVGLHAHAQDLNFNEEIRKLIEQGGKSSGTDEQDTVRRSQPMDTEAKVDDDTTNVSDEFTNHLDTIPKSDSLTFAGQDTISVVPLSEAEQDTIPAPLPELEMSHKALFWSRVAFTRPFREDVTFRDTVIVSQLFMPLLFKPGHVLPLEKITFWHPMDTTVKAWEQPLWPQEKWFEREQTRLLIEEMAYRHVQHNGQRYMRYNAQSLPHERIFFIQKEEPVNVPVEKREIKPAEYTPPTKFIPDRKYWISSFTSRFQFSQNQISPNWSGGGVSNMNILATNTLLYNYAKDKVKFNNTFEINASMYNAPKDTLREYKIGTDLFRYRADFGYRAFNRWYYTLVSDFRTQMFTNYRENTTQKQAALLSPFIVTVEPGMKYDLVKTYKRKDRSLTVGLNISPFSYKFMYSMDKDIDLGRHGFKKDEDGNFENRYSEFGSTLRFNMVANPNRNLRWTSNFSYFTSYTHVKAEFDNVLDLAISRYFSTTITLNLRYDDGVAKKPDYDSFIQYNEVLSFGFRYSW